MQRRQLLRLGKVFYFSVPEAAVEMPTPKVEFVAVLDDSDDEIEVIPYVKPPPVVIELVESDSENANSTGERKKKKKSKKKKNKRDKEHESFIDDASHGTDPSVSFTASSQIDSSVMNDEELTTGQNVEPEATSSGYSSSSGNVAVRSSSPVEPQTLHNAVGQGLSSSYFEANDYTQSLNQEGISVVTDAAVVETTAQNQKRSRSKEKRIRGEGKPRTRKISATQRTNEEIVNFLTTLGIQMEASAFESPAKKRRQHKKGKPDSSVDGGTDYISTDNSFCENSANTIENQEHQLQTNPSAEAGKMGQGEFVEVTQETNKASKNSPRKGKRQRTAIVGDISDFQVSFSRDDLNSINTNFQSNVVFASTDNTNGNFVEQSDRLQNYEIVIDSVARSGIVELESAASGEGGKETPELQHRSGHEAPLLVDNITPHAPEDETSQTSSQKDEQSSLENASCSIRLKQKNVAQSSSKDKETATKATSSNIPETGIHVVEDSHNKSDDRIESSDQNSTSHKQKQPSSASRDSFLGPSVDSHGSSSTSTDNETKKDCSSTHQENLQPTTKRHKPDRDVILNNISIVSTSNTASSATAIPVQESHQGPTPSVTELPQTQSTCSEVVPYFPSTWTEHMKDFYGSSHNEGFELDDVLHQLSDAPGKWRAIKDIMPPPKSKHRYVRCDNCKQMGHLSRNCYEKRKVPCCHMCGAEGHTSDHHSRRPCPEAKCLNCGRNQGQFAQRCPGCLLRRHPRNCEICNVIGHDITACPDNWRPYHSTTSIEDYENAKPAVDSQKHQANSRRSSNYYKTSSDYRPKSAMFCSNCGRRGHSYYDCNQTRFNPYHRNKPFAIRDVPVVPIVKFLDATSNSNTIPISYDARTGRTVVLNTERNELPEIAVETIQVQITNELAVGVRTETQIDIQQQTAAALDEREDKGTPPVANELHKSLETTDLEGGNNDCFNKDPPPPSTGCQQHEKCTNSPKPNDECRQTILQTQSFLTLLKAQEDGLLKLIEEKHGVEISLINDNNRFHICGDAVPEAQKDVSRILWSKENNSHLAMVFTNEKIEINNTKAARNSAGGSKTHDVSNSPKLENNTTFGDDNILAGENVIAKNPSSWKSLKSRENVVQVVTLNDAYLEDEDDECCVIAELPKGTNGATELASTSSAIASLAKTRLEAGRRKQKTSLSNTTTESPTVKQTPADGDSISDTSFLKYESPLAGLTLGNLGTPSLNTVSQEVPAENRIQYNPLKSISPEIHSTVLDSQSSRIPNPMYVTETSKSFKTEKTGKELNSSIQSTSNNTGCNNSVVDKEKISAIEIITLDDDEEETLVNNVINVASDENEEKVTLLKSEFDLVASHSLKAGNIIRQISSTFNVDLVISNVLSCVIISKGTKENRKIAKDNIVFWLECQSSNSEFHILTTGYKQLIAGTPNKPKKQNKKLKRIGQRSTSTNPQNMRLHKPNDIRNEHQITPKGKKRSPRKRWKKIRPPQQNHTTALNNQPATPRQNVLPNGNGIFATPPYYWDPSVNSVNFDSPPFPMQSANPEGLVMRSPRKGNKNNSPYGTTNTPRSRFNFHPPKPRYFS
ncbi:unnamed protein product [Orchesella dallaii]|uniref:Zinc finger CCHC domain-containing protein 7 n=1 Tax=Orchesella dallaii TaxID=48710 RepID=A0ABP1QN06_9HEXA